MCTMFTQCLKKPEDDVIFLETEGPGSCMSPSVDAVYLTSFNQLSVGAGATARSSSELNSYLNPQGCFFVEDITTEFQLLVISQSKPLI